MLGCNYVFVRLERMNLAGPIDYSETSRILEVIRSKPIGTRCGDQVATGFREVRVTDEKGYGLVFGTDTEA